MQPVHTDRLPTAVSKEGEDETERVSQSVRPGAGDVRDARV